MLRFAYRCLLRLHPPYFQRRFSPEMLSIFDQQKGTLAVARLLADGVLSLLRQWVLRPEFWEEPIAQPTADGVPVFYMIEGFKPRTGALLDGALMSAVVFTAVCMTMGYTWSHPARGPVISVYRSGSSIFWRPPASSLSDKRVANEPPIYVDGGRVVVMIQVQGRSGTPSVGTK
jgi:hypothetical protein